MRVTRWSTKLLSGLLVVAMPGPVPPPYSGVRDPMGRVESKWSEVCPACYTEMNGEEVK